MNFSNSAKLDAPKHMHISNMQPLWTVSAKLDAPKHTWDL